MLILKRYPEQSILIGKDIEIIILGNTNSITRLGIIAPPNLKIIRKELRPHITDIPSEKRIL
jgi:carbon storage regulator CsrA